VFHDAAKRAYAFGGVNTLALPRSAQGHEDPMSSSTLSRCCRLGKATFGGTHGNEKGAPEAGILVPRFTSTAAPSRYRPRRRDLLSSRTAADHGSF